jgi:hypothetical protein
MTRSTRPALSFRRASAITVALGIGLGISTAFAQNYPITEKQRSTAQQVASTGVPLSELAANAPDSYTIKSRDTLWDISRLYLKSPWRWPELWGMNLQQIRNPHLIYPGQTLYLVKSDGRASLRVGQGEPGGTVRLSPRVRANDLDRDGIPSIPLHLIEPFLNEAVIFNGNELANAPRVVAAQDGRVLLSRGDLAYVRGELGGSRNFRLFREPRPLTDPTTNEVLGYEGVYLGTSEFTRKKELAGQSVSIYGEGFTAGQNQIVALNRGSRDGVENGHVLALWRDGNRVVDKTNGESTAIKLPDERHGNLFVFRVFDRMAYALILSVQEPVKRGDRFSQP